MGNFFPQKMTLKTNFEVIEDLLFYFSRDFVFPSFLTHETIPKFKTFDFKTDQVRQKVQLWHNVSSTRNNFADNCDLSGLMLPPLANSVKMPNSFKSKAAKRPSLPLSSALSRKLTKRKQFSCTDCDTEVMFKSRIELRHHQSGNCLLCIANQIFFSRQHLLIWKIGASYF